MKPSIADLKAAAALYMPQEVVDAWSTTFRPGLRLSAGTGSRHAVGQLGGEPALPADMEWPVWQGYGPLSLLASVDCARLPRADLDLPLPTSGTLLFFYFDGQLDTEDRVDWWLNPEKQNAARVIFVPSDVPSVPRPTPPELTAWPRFDLTCESAITAPLRKNPALRTALLANGTALAEWLEADMDFEDAYAEVFELSEVQLGGFANPIQDAVEMAAALSVLGEDAEWDDPVTRAEAARWVLLAQFYPTEHSGMTWRHADTVFWLIRPEDLAAGRFDQAFFTCQV